MRHCELCGGDLEEHAGRGRPRKFCGQDCKMLAFTLTHLSGMLWRVAKKEGVDRQKMQRIKQELWSMGNLVNVSGPQEKAWKRGSR